MNEAFDRRVANAFECARCRVEWAAALEVLRTYPSLLEATGATNQCSIATDRLLAEMGTATVSGSARKIWFGRHRRPELPNLSAPRGFAEHAVLLAASGCVIDLTRRQYEPGAPVPLHYSSLAAAGEDWCLVNHDPAHPEDGWQPLSVSAELRR